MEHLPTALIERDQDEKRHSGALALMKTLGMPYGFIADNGPGAPTSMGGARRAGAIGLSGEFGGGATVTPASMRFTMTAIDNLLQAAGVTGKPMLVVEPAPAETIQLLSLSRHSQGIYATRRGWFEPAAGRWRNPPRKAQPHEGKRPRRDRVPLQPLDSALAGRQAGCMR